MDLKTQVDTQIENEYQQQVTLYETLVGEALEHGTLDDIGTAYESYVQQLNHFDISAYRKTLELILESDEETLSIYQDLFDAIPEYINHRNNFQIKVKEILDNDGDTASKQAQIDSLDFRRTQAHNRVIMLFNKMNTLAEENGIAHPYPRNGVSFDKDKPTDRELVAEILTKHETVMETVNTFVQSKSVKKIDYRSMTPSQLLRHIVNATESTSISEIVEGGVTR